MNIFEADILTVFFGIAVLSKVCYSVQLVAWVLAKKMDGRKNFLAGVLRSMPTRKSTTNGCALRSVSIVGQLQCMKITLVCHSILYRPTVLLFTQRRSILS